MNGINQPITNPTLVAAMAMMNTEESEQAAMGLVQAIQASKFILPITFKGEYDSNGQITKEGEMQFRMANSPQGEGLILAFTDLDALKVWAKEEPQTTILADYDEIASLIFANAGRLSGLFINMDREGLILPLSLMRKFPRKK